MRRYCKHSQLVYLGMLAERHLGYQTEFMDDGKAERSAGFADALCEAVGDGQEEALETSPINSSGKELGKVQ